jgi:hypothetical protein
MENIQNPTQEQIEEWKKKYGDIHVVKLEGKKCYVRKPLRKDIAYSSKAKDFVQGKEIVVNACFLGGDEEFKNDDDLFFALSSYLDELTKIKQVEIEKL